MRTFTLSLMVLLFAVVSFAQYSGTIPPHQQKRCIPEKVKKLKPSESLKDIAAIGDTLYYEDFNGGLGDWSTADISPAGNDFIWVHTTTGPSGPYAGTASALESTTAANGWAMLDSDLNGNGMYDAVLISPAIDLTNKPAVLLTFEEYFRQWQGTVFVAVSTDGTNWDEEQIHTDVSTNSGTDNPYTYYWNVSALIGGSSTAYVRFRMAGDWDYYWQVDDIAILESAANDLVVNKCFANTFYTNGAFFSKITMGQATVATMGGEIENAGSIAQNDVRLSVTVDDGITTIYDQYRDSVGGAWESADKDTMMLDSALVLQGLPMGNYTANYVATSAETDQIPGNNTLSVDFQVTDTILAHHLQVTTSISPQNYIGAASGDFVGTNFYLPYDDTVSSITFYINSVTTPGTIVVPEIHLVDDVLGEYILQIDGEELIITDDDIGQWHTLAMTSDDGVQENLTGGNDYVAAVKCLWGSDTDTIRIGADGSRDYLHADFQENALRIGTGIGWYSGPTPCVTMNMRRTIQYDPIVATITASENVSCFSELTGSATVTPTGGDLIYVYQWDDDSLQTTATATNLGAGTYTVVVSDGQGNIDSATVAISEPAESLVIVETESTTCGADGTLSLNITGGLAPYNVAWSNGDSGADLTDLGPGMYYYNLIDDAGCHVFDSMEVIGFAPPTITISSFINETTGNSDGAIDINVTGGTTPYTFAWSNGETTEDIDSIPAGDYTVVVTTADLCTDSISITLIEVNPACDLLAEITASTQVSCYNGADGTATITASSSELPITYLWDNGEATETAIALTAGTHFVTVTDNINCNEILSVDIVEPAAITGTAVVTNETVATSDGAIDLTAAGGSGSYTYLWVGSEVTEDISGLTAGWYSVTITDGNSCTGTGSFYVLGPPPPSCDLAITMTLTQPDCYNEATGEAIVVATGGTAPYTYEWSNGETTDTITAIMAGTYTVVVSDASAPACFAVIDTILAQPEEIVITTDSVIEATYSSNNGEIYISVTGGTGSYTYLWDNADATEDITGLVTGLYNVTVTDDNLCVATKTIMVSEEAVICDSLSVTITSTNITCSGVSDGIVLAEATSSNPGNFTYVWSNGGTTASMSALDVGTFYVTVIDGYLCMISDSAVVTSPDPLNATYVASNVKCKNGFDGSIDLTTTGGTTPYTFLWETGHETEDLTDLPASAGYGVSITDANGCEFNISGIAITQPNYLITHQVSTVPTTCLDDIGEIYIYNVSGGIPGTTGTDYTYNWAHGASNDTITGLGMGTYSYSITDSVGCVIVGSVELDVAGAPEPTGIVTHESNTDLNDGSIDITVTDGTSPFTYNWLGGPDSLFTSTSEDISGLEPGWYYITVTDVDGCIGTGSFYVLEFNIACVDLVATVTDVGGAINCPGDASGELSIAATGGTAPYTYQWDDAANSTSTTITNLPGGTYICLVTDSINCQAIGSAVVVEPDELVITLTSTETTDSTTEDGTCMAEIVGGTAPYSYLWSNGFTGATTFGLGNGPTYVTVTDGNGCTAVAMDTVAINVEEIEFLDKIKFFPNPTEGIIYVVNADRATITVFNILGVIVKHIDEADHRSVIDISNQASGTYLMKIQMGDEFITRRISLTK